MLFLLVRIPRLQHHLHRRRGPREGSIWMLKGLKILERVNLGGGGDTTVVDTVLTIMDDDVEHYLIS